MSKDCQSCANYKDKGMMWNEVFWYYIVPSIILLILYLVKVEPIMKDIIPDGLYEKVVKAIENKELHLSHLFYIVSTVSILVLTVIITLFASAPWFVRVFFVMLFILFSGTLNTSQNIFLLDDAKKEKKQSTEISKSDDIILYYDIKIDALEKRIIYLEQQLNKND